jgi:hypothetical protein
MANVSSPDNEGSKPFSNVGKFLPDVHGAASKKTSHLQVCKITQACKDFAATIIIGEMGYTKCRDSKNVNGFYISRTDFLQFLIYIIS